MLLLTSSNNPPLTSPLPLNKSGNMEPVNHSFQRREHTANATYKAGHIKTNPDPEGTKRAHGHPRLGGGPDFRHIPGNMEAASSVEALPGYVPGGEKVFISNSMYVGFEF